MQQADKAATSFTPRPRRKGVTRGLGWLPVAGLAAMVALTVAHSYNPFTPPRHPPKRLEIHAKSDAAVKPAAVIAPAHEAPRPIAARIVGTAIAPVATATAPGASADGTLRVAATLFERAVTPPPPVTAPTTIAAARPAESTGKAPAGGADINADIHPVQVAALIPLEHGAAERPLAMVAPVAPPPPTPWQTYAQPFNRADRRPRIAVVVAGADDAMDRAIDTLPPAVTLALDPYARRLPEWIELARARGHEVLLTLSVPAIGHGRRDAGPMAILSSLDPKENLERLDWALDRASGFVGVLDIVGNRPADETAPILARLEQHGLMLVSGTGVSAQPASLPLAIGDALLTPDLPRREVEQRLHAVEEKVRRDGHAVAIGIVGPATLRELAAWLATLPNKSIALVPTTALIAPPPATGIARE